MNIEINIEKYLSKFTVRESPMLFDLDFKELQKSLSEGICYVCNCKLKQDMKGNVYCVSARHKRMTKMRFFIRADKLKVYLSTV